MPRRTLTKPVTAQRRDREAAAKDGLRARLIAHSGDAGIARGSTSDAVATVLRDSILDGLLKPGSWLREAELASELKVSRTPIRDAFRTLSSEGLLQLRANKGALVPDITGDDIVELYAVRESLEGVAARLASRRASSEHVVELQQMLARMKTTAARGRVKELHELDVDFHVVIRTAAGNRYLTRFLSEIQNAVRRLQSSTYELPGRFEESLGEHGRIARAIADHDAERAERLAREHMRRLAEVRIRMLLQGF